MARKIKCIYCGSKNLFFGKITHLCKECKRQFLTTRTGSVFLEVMNGRVIFKSNRPEFKHLLKTK